MEKLNVKEVAKLKNCTVQYVRLLAKKGKLKADIKQNPSNNKKEYVFDVDTLPDELKNKYYRNLNKKRQVFKDRTAIITENKKKIVENENDQRIVVGDVSNSKYESDKDGAVSCKNVSTGNKDSEYKENIVSCKNTKYGRSKGAIKKVYSDFSESERAEIDTWIEIIKYWIECREIYKCKEIADRDILGSINLKLKKEGKNSINITTLYRKYDYYKNNDLEGLIDKRGGHNKGTSSIPEAVWNGFLNFYLDDRKMPFSEVYRNTVFWTQQFYPEFSNNMASEMSFRRKYKNDMLHAVEVYKRYGLKALLDKCIPYVDRLYDDLNANDVWIVDNHTLDIQSKNDEGSIHRLSITAFMDAKSGIITGFNVTDNPSMNSTIFALRCGILKFGKPKAILADNGSEFLTYDFAGRGIRKKNAKNIIDEYKTILGRLDINFYTAKVKNAKAKNVERFFLDFKNHISKSFSTYTGGNVMERPESLKVQIKKGNIPTDSRIREVIGDMIMLENMNSYGGKDKLKYKNMSKIDVFNKSINDTIQTIIPESDLDLFLMRAKALQKVGRNGVYIKIAGEKLWYNCEDYWKYLNKKVMLRYDPTNLASVRVYDEEDRYIGTWELEKELYLSFIEMDKEKIADANEKIARTAKAIKQYANDMLKLSPETKIDILDLKIRKAKMQSDGYIVDKSKVFHIQRYVESSNSETKKTGTDDTATIIDISKMNKNIESRK